MGTAIAQRAMLPLIKPDLPAFEEVEPAFREVLANGRITNFGKYVTAFECACSDYLGVNTATVSSGTMGLLFALQAVGVRPGQRVILPSFTFMATAQAVVYAAAVPVFAEVGSDLTLDPQDLADQLAGDAEVAAVFAVHAFGLPCHVDEISEVVRAYETRVGRPVPLLYDAAHAFGSRLNGRAAGSFGSVEVFSLSATKALGCVEGGLVASRDAAVVEKVRRMRNYGIESNYDAQWPGMNGKMSELHAIVGLANLRRLDETLSTRAEKAVYYERELMAHTKCELIPRAAGIRHTFTHFTVLLPECVAARRDRIAAWLQENAIETRAYWYPPVHEQKFFASFTNRELPRTAQLSRRVLSLPFHTTMSEAEMTYVAQMLGQAEKMFG